MRPKANPQTLVANARMYSVNAEASALWRELFQWVSAHAGIALTMIDHGLPATLGELWRRDDLGCAFMCGYPWASWSDPAIPRPSPLAVPLTRQADPRPPAMYCSDIVVRNDSSLASVEELHGARFAFTAVDSQSGYQAPRRLFAAHARRTGDRWFSAMVGPLITPRRVVEALLQDEADAGPLDSYWHALLRAHEPATAAQLRVIARTPLTAMPLLVCAARVSADARRALVQSLTDAGHAPQLSTLREGLLLEGFAAPDAKSYRRLITIAHESDTLGYPVLQ